MRKLLIALTAVFGFGLALCHAGELENQQASLPELSSFKVAYFQQDDINIPMPPVETITRVGEKASQTSISGTTDMQPFFRRLESVGFETKELRAITSKIKVVFGGQSSDAAGEYGYILNKLRIPLDFKEPGSDSMRFDLQPYDISTLLHEYVHAAKDVSADPKAPKGTPAREQYDAVNAIQADIRSQSLLCRYPWMKADEVSAYFMGDAINTVFDAVNDVVSYNTMFQGAKPVTLAEAERLGGRLIIPSPSTPGLSGWELRLLKSYAKFGQNSVYEDAQFHDNPITGFMDIHWVERQNIKDDIYNNVLGLKPPKNLQELVDRLNSVDNDWIRDVRKKVAETRLKNAKKTEAEAAKP